MPVAQRSAFFLRIARCSEYPIAIACFSGYFPVRISAAMFFERAAFDALRINGTLED